ncbi:MAG: SGNH/GDSL hydrolase family protein [Gammaproteobacteria bacterium]|nr:SGNH/GDSL hydrolase family protein [Gammaproteobacteria bacterium]
MLPLRIALQISWYALFPVFLLLLPQAIYVKKTTLRLPEASGSSLLHFAHASENTLRVIHFGESTVAGVGIDELNQGLSFHICQQVQSQLPVNIECEILGENGIRIHELNATIAKHTGVMDIAIITMGVNDTTKLTSIKKWRKSLQTSIAHLQHKGVAHIFFMQVPPMAQFPALPAPLKYFLGLRAYQLDLELQALMNKNKCCHYVGSKLLVERHFMAKDGYHPSAQGYAAWAEQISPLIIGVLKGDL